MENQFRKAYIDRINQIYNTFILNGDLYIKYPGNERMGVDPKIDSVIRAYTLVNGPKTNVLERSCPTEYVACFKNLLMDPEALTMVMGRDEYFKYFSANHKNIVGSIYKFPLEYINSNKLILLKNLTLLNKIMDTTYNVFVNYVPLDPNNVSKYDEKAKFFNRFCYHMRTIIDTTVKVFDLYMPIPEEKKLDNIQGGNLYLEEIPTYVKLAPEEVKEEHEYT